MAAVPARALPTQAIARRPLRDPTHTRRFGTLFLAGLALLAILQLGFSAPFNLWDYPRVIEGSRPIVTVLGAGSDGAAEFLATIVAAFGAYALSAWVARRVAGRSAALVVLLGVCCFSAALLPTNPVGAHDVYHNIADARTFWIYGQDPAVTPPIAHPLDPLYEHVAAWEDHASSYGPLWYMLSGVPLPVTGTGLWANVIGQRLLTVAFLLGTTALVMAVVGRIRPGQGVLAGVLVGWNPLLLFDVAVNAHNDIVMAAFVAAAVYALARRWWRAVFPALACAVAVKAVAVLLGPLFLLWLLRRRDVPRSQVAMSILLGLGTVALLYLPFSDLGGATQALRRHSDPILGSTGAALTSLLIANSYMDPQLATETMKRMLVPLFGVCYVALLWRLRRADTPLSTLTATSAWALFAFVVIVKWWFWPWYLMWVVPLAAMTPTRRVSAVVAVFSCTATLMYVVYMWQIFNPDWHEIHRETAAAVFALPVALVSALLMADAVRLLARLTAGVRGVPGAVARSAVRDGP